MGSGDTGRPHAAGAQAGLVGDVIAASGGEPSPRESLWMRRAGGPRILVLLALTNLVAYAVRNALFGVYPDLRAEFHVNDQTLGFLATVFLIPHAVATLPFGWAGDRYDRRRVIAFGIMLSAVASVAGAASRDMWTLGISRAAVGLGTAAVVPVANSILGQLYEGPRKASRIALFNLGILVGGLVGFGAGIFVGYPAVVVVLAAPMVVLALLVLAMPIPAPVAARGPMPRAQEHVGLLQYLFRLAKAFFVDGKMLLRIRTLRWLIVSATAMAFAAGGFNAWLLDFLERDKQMTRASATTLISVAMIGAVAGIVVGGRLADRLRTRMMTGRLWTIALGMLFAIPCTAICIEIDPGVGLYVAGTLNFFFFSWYHAPIAATVDDLAPPVLAVSAQGLVIFTMHLFGTASASYVVGIVSDHSSLYTAMWVPAGALVLAGLTALCAIPSFAADHKASRANPAAS
ncbi:MAG TPA: MFS transporter [Kofleriaceae bacterium]|nr:MFS transporter [Kofleriaceae bacterium]